MSVHDRAAARAVPRFNLTVIKYHGGCMQTFEYEGLTEREVEQRKALDIETWGYPALQGEHPFSGFYSLDFEVQRT